jgi:hypothetical protein
MRNINEFFHVSESTADHGLPGTVPVSVNMMLQCKLCGSIHTIPKGKESPDYTVLDMHVATHVALFEGKLP